MKRVYKVYGWNCDTGSIDTFKISALNSEEAIRLAYGECHKIYNPELGKGQHPIGITNAVKISLWDLIWSDKGGA
jgi:hypothetical protein